MGGRRTVYRISREGKFLRTVAGISDQLFCCFHILLIVFTLIIVRGSRPCHGRVGRFCKSCVGCLSKQFLIQRKQNRFSHILIRQHRICLRSEPDRQRNVLLVYIDCDIVMAFQFFHLICGKVEGNLYIPGLQRRCTGYRILNERKFNIFVIGKILLIPVILVTDQSHLLPCLPGVQHIGTGTHRIHRKNRLVFSHFLKSLFREDRVVGTAKDLRQISVRSGKRHNNMGIIHHFRILHIEHQAVMIQRVIKGSLQRRLHIICRHQLAVAEIHIIAQCKLHMGVIDKVPFSR